MEGGLWNSTSNTYRRTEPFSALPPPLLTSESHKLFVIIEILHAGTTSRVNELRRRTEEALADLAPYAHVGLTRAATRKIGPSVPEHQLPVLLIDTKVVPASPANVRQQMNDSATPEAGTGVDMLGEYPDAFGVHPAVATPAPPPEPPLPTQRQIRATLAQVLLTSGPSAIRLPLVHRRIVSVALLLMVIGALLSTIVAIGPVLTYSGLLLLPIGLSTNGTRARQQPLMLIAGVACALSALLLLWYFGPLIFNTVDATPPSASILYGALLCLGAAWGSAAVALLTRRRLRQQLKDRLLQAVREL